MNFEDKTMPLLKDLVDGVNRIASTLEENSFKQSPIEVVKLARAEAMTDTFRDRLIEQGDEPFVIWAEEQVNKSFAPNMISD
jgi:hypothetical protein